MALFKAIGTQVCFTAFCLFVIIGAVTNVENGSAFQCSDILCAVSSSNNFATTTNCNNVANKCDCFYESLASKFDSTMMICRETSMQPVNFFYSNNNKILSLSPKDKRDGFNSAIQYLKPLLGVVEYQHLTMSFCSRTLSGDVYPSSQRALLPEDLLSSLNITQFPTLEYLIDLDLEMNCFRNITGIFASIFPNLRKLDLGNNFLTNIPYDALSGLAQLEDLNLFNNRLLEIRPYSFRNLKSLTTLTLHTNSIETLDENVFSSVVNLEHLSLGYNKIKVIPEGLLRNNLRLRVLGLEGNDIEHLLPFLFANLTKLTDLSLHDNHIRTLPPGLFYGLRNLKSVYLFRNKLFLVSPDQFVTNYKLTEFSLSGNSLNKVPKFNVAGFLDGAPPSITLSDNEISAINIPLTHDITSASTLSLSNNCLLLIRELNISTSVLFGASIEEFVCKNCCLFDVHPKLVYGVVSKVDLSDNYIQKIDMKFLNNIAHLDKIDISGNLVSAIEVNWSYPLIQDNSKPGRLVNPHTEIILHKHLLHCDCHLYPFILFMDMQIKPPVGLNRSLVSFDVENVWCIEPESLYGFSINDLIRRKDLQSMLLCNTASDCPSGCHCYYVPARNVTIYNCSNQEFSQFPQIPKASKNIIIHLENNLIRNLPPDSSHTWHWIEELYLNNNLIASVENLTISPKLKVLDLRNNHLKTFDSKITSVLESTITIFLSGNPWECNCEAQKVRYVIFSNVHLEDSKNITCTLPQAGPANLLSEISDYELCPELLANHRLLKSCLLIISGIAIAITATITVLYRYKAEVQFWLFTHECCLRFITEDDVDSDKLFDAFVSYSSLDEDWVANHLVRGLENGNPAYSLCLHNRDWPVGEWIPDQIFRSVQDSRRTIIVLTNNFVESDWSRLEFKAAHQQAIADQVNRVLILVPDKLPDLHKMDKELRTYINLNTYIKWNDAHFWPKLRCAMPRNTKVIHDKKTTKCKSHMYSDFSNK